MQAMMQAMMKTYLDLVVKTRFSPPQFENGAINKFADIMEMWFANFLQRAKRSMLHNARYSAIVKDFNESLDQDSPRRRRIAAGNFFKKEADKISPAVQPTVKDWYRAMFNCRDIKPEDQLDAQQFIQRFLISYTYEILHEAVGIKEGQEVTYEDLKDVSLGYQSEQIEPSEEAKPRKTKRKVEETQQLDKEKIKREKESSPPSTNMTIIIVKIPCVACKELVDFDPIKFKCPNCGYTWKVR